MNNKTYHRFSEHKCSYCNKSFDKLFEELLLKYENKDALEYIYRVQSGMTGYNYYTMQEIVRRYHEYCLTDDEIMIKNIIE